MSIDNEWDVNKYRTKFESDEHWSLKHDFIQAHKDNIPETRLICLAQVFVNIRLLRCVYPVSLMHQMEELGKGIGQTFTEKQQSRLQRTFISATDAIVSKIQNSSSRSGSEQNIPDLENFYDPAIELTSMSESPKNAELNLNNFVPTMDSPEDVGTESDLMPLEIENDINFEEESELSNLPDQLLCRLGSIPIDKSNPLSKMEESLEDIDLKVAVLGHSTVQSLNKSCFIKQNIILSKFGFDDAKTCHMMDYLDAIVDLQPNFCYLQMGENDLISGVNHLEVRDNISRIYRYLSKCGIKTFVGEIITRTNPRNISQLEYKYFRSKINKSLKREFKGLDVVQHYKFDEKSLEQDGVSLNEASRKILTNYIINKCKLNIR